MNRNPALPPSVVVAHPGRQHSYEVALAAQEHGTLRALATGFVVRNDQTAKALRLAGSRNSILASAGDRFHPSLDATRIKTFPNAQVIARMFRGLGRGNDLQNWADRRCDQAIGRWVQSLDPPPGVVHALEGGALSTLRAARAAGAATVLDVGSAHEWFCEAIEAEGGRVDHSCDERVRLERELADVLVVPSDYVADCLAQHGVDRSRIVLVPFGVDPERFAPPPARDDDVFRVLFVGSTGVRKGLRYLLDVWRDLNLPNAELVIAGANDVSDRTATSCRWLGQVPRTEIARWFARSDLFVLPSLAEGSALVTYEAMASGIPVITTPNAGSVMLDGQHGYLVPPREVSLLGERIRELHADSERRRAFGRAAREFVISNYTWEHYRRRVAAVHSSLLANHPVSAYEPFALANPISRGAYGR